MKAHLEGGRERNGSQCEGTAAKGVERRWKRDLTHVVKVREEKRSDGREQFQSENP